MAFFEKDFINLQWLFKRFIEGKSGATNGIRTREHLKQGCDANMSQRSPNSLKKSCGFKICCKNMFEQNGASIYYSHVT